MNRLAGVMLTVVAPLMLVTLARGDDPSKTEKVPESVKKDFGEETIAILSGAKRVEVFRLEKQQAAKAGPNTIGVGALQFIITATGKEKGKEFAAKVRSFVLDKATREPSGASGFRGWVAFRLWKEKASATIFVDFEGYQFLVVSQDANGKQIKAVYGGFLVNAAKGEIDDGTLYGRIRDLAVEAFPDDATLKMLNP